MSAGLAELAEGLVNINLCALEVDQIPVAGQSEELVGLAGLRMTGFARGRARSFTDVAVPLAVGDRQLRVHLRAGGVRGIDWGQARVPPCAAFRAAGRAAGAYAAPAENVQSFLEGHGQLHIGSVQPTYDRGVTAADLGALLPGELADTLRAGLRAYERKIAGYTAPDAILTGLETRTSSPVRLKREEDFVCSQLAGLYPCGEGAGYAGGIMSAAVDGLRVARAIISRYAPAEG